MSEDQLSWDERRARNNRQYQKGWEKAPKVFLNKAAKAGIKPHVEDLEGDAVPFDGNYVSSAYVPDMAAQLDDYIDQLIEHYGINHAVFIRAIAADLKKPMQEEIEKNRASLLGRIAGYLIYTTAEKGNMLARVHALLHSIPRYAKEAGWHSMRASARECLVSQEWLRRQRDKWCTLLGIEPPVDGTKTKEAKEKYRHNANTNHWRKQKFHADGS